MSRNHKVNKLLCSVLLTSVPEYMGLRHRLGII
jgi:hypothetical protein